MTGTTPELSVSEFVAVFNQTLEYAYPSVLVTGEIANFRISKNRWVYFDLKDASSSVRFFGTTFQLPGPLEDGMKITVRGTPKLHNLYGFSVTAQAITLAGEGTIKKAAALLEAKLRKEGLFDEDRKRPLPYPPKSIGLITSGESAAYRDFMKILAARWGGVSIVHIDVQVQGEPAPAQISAAIRQFNEMADTPDVLVVTRGGGSADDLQAFSTEQVTRAVAASRIPTIVAIGHEVDFSLAELAADQRASTPSNAAELLVPDKRAVLQHLAAQRQQLRVVTDHAMHAARQHMLVQRKQLLQATQSVIERATQQLQLQRQLLAAYDPAAALQRGYAMVQKGDSVVLSAAELSKDDEIAVQLRDGSFTASVKRVTINANS
jgi:exodeoxyribonuclease VII large subunit